MGVLILLGLLPWVGVLAFLLFGVQLPPPLASLRARVREGTALPFVSVIVPARNEARNIQRLLTSLAASDYPDFEVIVLDDRSDDRTADHARAVARGNARRIVVRRGQALPEGWLGKPWACHQAAQIAEGDLLLFTDADTWHGPHLLRKAVLALRADRADLLSVTGRQLMLTFWEKLVQPQVFVGMLLRYRDQAEPLDPRQWRSAIANGQFILVPADLYRAEGGHEAVRGEVVEDLRMAQRWVRRGRRVSLRMGEEDFSTRMYTSLGEIVEGWTKNLMLGGLATLPPGWIRKLTPVLALMVGAVLWLLPPVVLVLGLAGVVSGASLLWSTLAVLLSMTTWILVSGRMGVALPYGTIYPLGSAVVLWITARAWIRGGSVRWKGRDYEVDPETVWREP